MRRKAINIILIIFVLGLCIFIKVREQNIQSELTKNQEIEKVEQIKTSINNRYSFSPNKNLEDVQVSILGGDFQFKEDILDFYHKLLNVEIKLKEDVKYTLTSEILNFSNIKCTAQNLRDDGRINNPQAYIETYIDDQYKENNLDATFPPDENGLRGYITRFYNQKYNDIDIINLGYLLEGNDHKDYWTGVTINQYICPELKDPNKTIKINKSIQDYKDNLWENTYIPFERLDLPDITDKTNLSIQVNSVQEDYFYIESQDSLIPVFRLEGDFYIDGKTHPFLFWKFPY